MRLFKEEQRYIFYNQFLLRYCQRKPYHALGIYSHGKIIKNKLYKFGTNILGLLMFSGGDASLGCMCDANTCILLKIIYLYLLVF